MVDLGVRHRQSQPPHDQTAAVGAGLDLDPWRHELHKRARSGGDGVRLPVEMEMGWDCWWIGGGRRALLPVVRVAADRGEGKFGDTWEGEEDGSWEGGTGEGRRWIGGGRRRRGK